jgi:transposase
MNTYPQGGVKLKKQLKYNQLPIKVGRKEFNRYIKPHLHKPTKGPDPKLSLYKLFNYILYVLHTGIQWDELKTRNKELHWSNVYKWHNRWSKDGSYYQLFLASVMELNDAGKLDLSILHGDGSNTVAKKGANKLAIPGINIKKAVKPWLFATTPGILLLP